MVLAVGFSKQTESDLRTTLSNASRLDSHLIIETELAVARVAELLIAAIRREFKPHDTRARDRYQKPGHIHTLDTLKLTINGARAEITMDGAAVLVWKGTRPHTISAKGPDGWLIFKGSRGWVRKRSVEHPGTKQDDYVGRSVASVDLSDTLGAMLGGARVTLMQGIIGRSGQLTYIEQSAPPLQFQG